ncbi:protein kinase activating protein dpb11 [Didymella sp. IMI 355093]|nr:protein kinase activating protein dpb11 [Didymella sp. IMI 355093]
MGATIKLDLTSDVTHLVAGNTDSAKYRYVAKLREDVKVLSPGWLEALREVWMEGDDNMDMAGLEKQYRLPTFFGLKICLTGFDNPEQRKYIQETADQNGAEYHGDLTKNVTHLIAAAPTGKKYEHALNWRMKIVSLEWFEQSLKRGMVLDETLYNPTLPVEERGKDAWVRIENPSPALGKRTRDAEQPQPLNPNRRKLRRAASTKLGIQGDALWAEIITPSGDRSKNEEDEWKEDNLPKQTTPYEDSPVTLHHNDGTPQPDNAGETNALAHAAAAPARPSELDQGEGIFQGRIVVIHGFDQDKVDVVSGSLPESAGSVMNLVTNWWVERCLYGKRLVDPTEDVLSRPFDKLSINVREPSPDSVIPAPSGPPDPMPQPQHPAKESEEERDYSDLLTKLRANRKEAPTPEDQADEKRRRRRQLGRATSARSITSTGDVSSGNPDLGLNAEDEDETIVINEYQPSQELGWDSPGAAKAREAMIKKLGGTLKERSVPVKAIGGAMDGPSESGMTSRAGRKRRPGF